MLGNRGVEVNDTEVTPKRIEYEVLKVLEAPTEKVELTQRSDGAFSYRKLSRQGEKWGEAGPDCGIYDTAATAEAEARARIWWLAAIK